MKKLVLFILINFVCSNFAWSQNDFGLWSGIGIKATINKKFDVGLDGEARFDRNVSRMNKLFISPFVQYDANDYFRISVAYRLSSSPYNSTSTNRINSHRYTLDLEFRNILKLFFEKPDLDMDMRLRGTTELEKQNRSDNYLRYRLKFDYNLPKTKLKPSISAEFFLHFNDQLIYTFDEVIAKHNMNKFRLKGGLSYPLKKKHEVEIFGIYQNQLLDFENEFILGIGYRYSMSFKSKKD